MDSETCVFCKLIRGELFAQRIFEDEKILVFPDIAPKAATHLLFIPKQHIDSMYSMSSNEVEKIMGDIFKVLHSIVHQFKLEGFQTIINTGREGGQEVFHLHVHLLAKKKLKSML